MIAAYAYRDDRVLMSLMTRPVSDWPRSWSWSYNFGHDLGLELILYFWSWSCSFGLGLTVFFHAISTETVPKVTGHHFLTFFAPSYFL